MQLARSTDGGSVYIGSDREVQSGNPGQEDEEASPRACHGFPFPSQLTLLFSRLAISNAMLTSMLVVLLVLLGVACFGQTGEDARPLLREVADGSRRLSSYRAEGHIAQDLDIGIGGGKRDLAFRVATRSPQQMHIELSGGPEWATGLPIDVVCDGGSGWVYYGKPKQYDKVVAGERTQGYCSRGTLTSFEHVADSVKSAVIAGRDQVQFEGRSQACLVVQAQYRVIDDFMIPPGMVGKIGRVSRTMCVDPVRKLILRDRLEADLDAGPDGYHVIETISYDRIELNPDLPSALFEFHPPEGATLFKTPALWPSNSSAPKPSPAAPAPSARFENTMPSPVSRTEPDYSQEAWDEGIQGKVIVVAVVEPDGTAHDFSIDQSLGFGLDEKAIECARKWRFNPATSGGKPTKGTAWIEFNFSLPDKRPEQPSGFPVARPVRPPRLPEVELEAPTDLDDFFYLVAIDFKTPALCARIHHTAAGGGGAARGHQVYTLQSSCYYELATELHDASLCEHVRPVRTDGEDGSKFDKEYCLQNLQSGNGGEVPHRMDVFVGLMQRLGYDDRQVADFIYSENDYNNPTHAAYEQLRKEKQFLDRIHAARSYDEPRSEARIRPAHAAEFLYEMLAIDLPDPDLCSKVSPNATFKELDGGTALLRSWCYRTLAENERNAAFCDQLPRLGAFPHTKPYESRESCHEIVAIYRRPGFNNNGLRNGPRTFPSPGYFQEALQQVGYSKAYAAALVPKPTPHDYWEFVSDMSLGDRTHGRAEFLRRVTALK